jgi:hypothetical protein
VVNHRSIRDEQEFLLMPSYQHRLPALPVAAVFGANASGKSNLLDALRWFQRAVLDSYRSWDPEGGIPRQPFRLDALSATEPTVLVADLLIDGVQYVYGVELDSSVVREEWLHAYPHQHKRVIFERQGQQVEFGSTVPERRGRADLLSSLLRENSLLLSAAVQAKQEEVLPVYRWFARDLWFIGDLAPRMQDDRSTAERVASGVRRYPVLVELVKAADLDITDLEVVETATGLSAVLSAQADQLAARIARLESSSSLPEKDLPTLRQLRADLDVLRRPEIRKELLFRHGADKIPLSYADQSAGTRAWLALLMTTLEVLETGATLVTDEIDASLHPRLTARLIELFQSETTNRHGAQLIFTTHDATLLGTSLGEELLRRDEIWFIAKKDSASTLYPLSDFRPRKGENRERRYLGGSYGAVPVVFPDTLVDRFAEFVAEEPAYGETSPVGGSDDAAS